MFPVTDIRIQGNFQYRLPLGPHQTLQCAADCCRDLRSNLWLCIYWAESKASVEDAPWARVHARSTQGRGRPPTGSRPWTKPVSPAAMSANGWHPLHAKVPWASHQEGLHSCGKHDDGQCPPCVGNAEVLLEIVRRKFPSVNFLFLCIYFVQCLVTWMNTHCTSSVALFWSVTATQVQLFATTAALFLSASGYPNLSAV